MALDKDAVLNQIADALPEIMSRLGHGRPITNGEMELTIGQVRALRAIGGEPGCTMGELAHKLGISLSAATGLVDRLVQRDLVEREGSASDRRVVCLRLADAGKRARKAFQEERRRRMAAALWRLSAEDLEQIAGSINLLRTALEASQGEPAARPAGREKEQCAKRAHS